MEDISFIFISSKPWYSPLGGTAKSLAFELGKKYPTYYINSPLDRKTLLNGKSDPAIQNHLNQVKQGSQLVQVANKLWQYYPSIVLESINWIPFTPLFKWFNYLNNKKLARELKKLIKSKGIGRYVIINDKDIFRGFNLKEIMHPSLFVYLDRDYVLGVPYWAKHGNTMEPELMEKADLVLCNSQLFTDTAKKYNNNSHFIGNGCDIDLFNGEKAYPIPSSIQHIPRPWVGYAGALVDHRLDIELLETVANKRPDWSFILIGKEDETFQQSSLHQLSNVYFLGPKALNELPGYYTAMDVCINPQLVNDITQGNYPMKIDEYLAMGKPVVAMQTHAMEYFAEHTYLAKDAASFVALLETALKENNEWKQQERIRFARQHSWPLFTENVLQLIHARLESNA